MALLERDVKSMLADKKQLQALMAQQNARMGVTADPAATAEKAQALSQAFGVGPEENLLSRGIIEMRDEE